MNDANKRSRVPVLELDRIERYLERITVSDCTNPLCAGVDCFDIGCTQCVLDTNETIITNIDTIVKTWIERDGKEW